MFESNQPIISICIPTYNRCEKLHHCLSKLLSASAPFNDQVEIIVSDNASEDDTQKIIKELQKTNVNLKAFRNDYNIGFNRNFFRLTDEYASGQFLWIIGDDDFIDNNAITAVIEILANHPHLEFLALNFRLLPPLEASLYINHNSTFQYTVNNLEKIIDMQGRIENLLVTFMSCNILKREVYSKFDKSLFASNSWDNFQSVFPHSYMIAKCISATAPAAYIETPLMSVCVHSKAWDDKLAELYLKRIVEMYRHYTQYGFKHLKRTYKLIIKSNLKLLFSRNVNKDLRIYFWHFIRYSYTFYACFLVTILKKSLKCIKF